MLRYLRDAVATRSRGRTRAAESIPRASWPTAAGTCRSSGGDIERRLREGEILAVVATNALELGIDIGELDAVVCAGYPGSVAATWQRFGRAGRRGAESICVLVASSAPLDQYLAREPAFLLGAPGGAGADRPGQRRDPRQHLKCAAFELPFKRGEAFGSLGPAETTGGARASSSATASCTSRAARSTGRPTPTRPTTCRLRSVGWDNVVIIDVERDQLDRRARLARRPHDAPRAGHLPARRRVLAGRALRLREPQGLRAAASSPTTGPTAMTYVQVARHRGERDGARDGRSGDRDVGERLGRGRRRREGRRVQEDQVLHARERRLRRRAPARDADAHDGVLADGARGACARARDGAAPRPSTACAASAMALETVATLALMCDPRDLGTTLGRRRDGTTSGAPSVPRRERGGPRPGYDPDAVPLRARARGHRPGRAHLGAARRAARADATDDRELPLLDRVPRVRGPRRRVAQERGGRPLAPSAGGGGGLAVGVSVRVALAGRRRGEHLGHGAGRGDRAIRRRPTRARRAGSTRRCRTPACSSRTRSGRRTGAPSPRRTCCRPRSGSPAVVGSDATIMGMPTMCVSLLPNVVCSLW